MACEEKQYFTVREFCNYTVKVRQSLCKVFGKVSEKVTNLCNEAATRFR